MADFISRLFDPSEHSPFPYTIKEKSLYDNLTFSMVVQACLRGVMKQSGSGPPSLQIFDSISIRTESPKPKGLVAWSEKYLDGNKMSTVQINECSLSYWVEQEGSAVALNQRWNF